MALPAADPGRTCVITGASSGIGADLARLLAARGLGVTLVARRADRLATLAGDLRDRHGVRAEVLAADLTDEAARGALPGRLEELGLTVGVLVNNAGLSTVGPVARADRQAELAMIRTDVEAVVDLCTMFVPGLVRAGQGAVLNVASTAAFQPLPGQAGYGAAKAFVLSYSHALGGELRGTGVSVTALCPGPVRTEFFDAAGIAPESLSALPGFVWSTSEAVARAAVAGMAAGRPLVIPGLANKVSAMGGHLTPRPLLVPILRKFWPAMRIETDRPAAPPTAGR